MSVQVIEKNGQIEWAVVPYDEYQKMLDALEMLDDIQTYDEGIAAIQAGEELIPSKVVYALLDGENPIRVWREYRGKSLEEVAEPVGITAFELSQIEAGKQQATTSELERIAATLAIDPEDLAEAD